MGESVPHAALGPLGGPESLESRTTELSYLLNTGHRSRICSMMPNVHDRQGQVDLESSRVRSTDVPAAPTALMEKCLSCFRGPWCQRPCVFADIRISSAHDLVVLKPGTSKSRCNRQAFWRVKHGPFPDSGISTEFQDRVQIACGMLSCMIEDVIMRLWNTAGDDDRA